MSMSKCVRDLCSVVQDLFRQQARARRHCSLERSALDKLHGDERASVVLANFMNRADVRVIERSRRPGLTNQASRGCGIVSIGRRQHLDGDVALKPLVERSIDLAHPAHAEQRDDPIRAQVTPYHTVVWRRGLPSE